LLEGSEPIHKRVTWDTECASGDETKFKSLNIREQLNSVVSDLSATQGDVEFLKREHSKVAVTLKKVLERLDSEVMSPREQTCAANDTLKQEMSKLCEAQEKEVKQYVTTVSAAMGSSVDELKHWVEAKMGTWEEKNRNDALEVALQTTERLQDENKKLQSKLDAMTCAFKNGLENVETQFKHVIDDQAAALKGQMRNQMVSVNAEIRLQRNDLEREKNARETGYKNLMSVMDFRSKPVLPRQSKSAQLPSHPPVMDDVAKRVAHLAWQLETEVADRTAKMEITKRHKTEPAFSALHSFPL